MSKLIIRMLYVFLAFGYIGSWVTFSNLREPLKKHNTMLIEYAVQAHDGFKSYRTFKNVELIINKEIEEKAEETEEKVYQSFKIVNTEKLAKELLLGQKLTETILYKRVKTNIKEGFKIDATEDINKVISSKKNHPAVEKFLNLLINKKLLLGLLLLLTFPVFSPIIFAVLILVLVARRYLKNKADQRNLSYMELIPDIYTTNLVLAVLSLMIFSVSVYVGLMIALLAHILFIVQIFQGIRMKPLSRCLYCGSSTK